MKKNLDQSSNEQKDKSRASKGAVTFTTSIKLSLDQHNMVDAYARQYDLTFQEAIDAILNKFVREQWGQMREGGK